ncbi:MAG: hypothetical protein ACLFMP_02760, partial [Desulfonatronovibrionaceae bacterium]
RISGQDVEKSEQVVSQVENELSGRVRLSDRQLTVLERLESPWPKDPFWDPDSSDREKKSGDEQTDEKRRIVYSGFVQVAGTKYAVVNGREYTIGDKVKDTSFTVKDISSQTLVLRGPQGRIRVSAEGGDEFPGEENSSNRNRSEDIDDWR